MSVEKTAFSDAQGTQEIIEEYSEEDEKKWRERHKISVREQKKREAEERQRMHNEANDNDILAMLENAALLEELENDLDELEDESGTDFIQTTTSSQSQLTDNDNEYSEMSSVENWLEKNQLKNVEKESDSDEQGESDGVCPQAFLNIHNQAKEYPMDEKLIFYQKHLDEINSYLKNYKCVSYEAVQEYAEKRNVRECLMNAIDELKEDISAKHQVHKNNKSNIENSDNNKTNKETEENQEEQKVCKKRHGRSEFEELEKSYKHRSKSEQLIFYKSQLRAVMKSIASCTKETTRVEMESKRDLYDYIVNCIDLLRDKINVEKQAKLEERFVDDDTDNEEINVKKDEENVNEDEEENGLLNCDASLSEKENESPKRKICFAPEPSITTYHLDDEPWCLQNVKSVNEITDTTFQFFNSPCSSTASSVCDDNDAQDRHNDLDSDNNQTLIIKTNANYESTNKTLKSTINDCDDLIISKYKSSTTIESNNFVQNNLNANNDKSTLILKFSHSPNVFIPTQNDVISNHDRLIISPYDIYKTFGENCMESLVNSDKEKASINLPQNSVKSISSSQELSSSKTSSSEHLNKIPYGAVEPKKSILKNKHAVEVEIHGKVYEEVDEGKNKNQKSLN